MQAFVGTPVPLWRDGVEQQLYEHVEEVVVGVWFIW